MGTNYGNVDSFDLFQCEPFIPIYFAPKIKEENKNEINEDSISKRRKSSNFSESESFTRKSTLDEEENEKEEIPKITNGKKGKNFQNFFKNFPFSDDNKNRPNKFDGDNYYLNFNEHDSIRKNYFSKLILKDIWSVNNKSKTHNNLFIFDWDNTLLPTNFLSQEEIIDENLPKKYEEIFSILEKVIIKVINLAINKGDVYIITNSSIGWVEFSTNKYYPNLKKYLDTIHIISARSEYENFYPGKLKIWKEKTFLNLKKNINLTIPTNIICFGDSIIELEAGKKLASKINNSFIKTIKFQENPEPEDLIRQLNLIIKKFDNIYSIVKNVSIRIDKN